MGVGVGVGVGGWAWAWAWAWMVVVWWWWWWVGGVGGGTNSVVPSFPAPLTSHHITVVTNATARRVPLSLQDLKKRGKSVMAETQGRKAKVLELKREAILAADLPASHPHRQQVVSACTNGTGAGEGRTGGGGEAGQTGGEGGGGRLRCQCY